MTDLLAALRGHDPYDALLGTRVPGFLRRSKRGRQLAIQLRKRSPLDLSGVFGIPPHVMAKSVACVLTARLRTDDSASEVPVLERYLLDAQLKSGGWGYEFDVQTRWAYYPAGTANLIATAFAARALATAVALRPGHLAAREALAGPVDLLCGPFLVKAAGGSYFRYTESSAALVHNANLLGSGTLACLGRLFNDNALVERALRCAQTSVAAQRPDGSWPYGEASSLEWSDNFHTAYDLDGLLMVWLATGDEDIETALKAGVTHWMRDFFGPAGEPRYYPDRSYPYDIHSAATAMDVGARLATWGLATADTARRVAEWTDANLVDHSTGATKFQKHRVWTDRRHFVRWGDAHLALGRASLGVLDAGTRDPLEEAVRRG